MALVHPIASSSLRAASRNRIVAALFSLSFVAGARLLVPDPDDRASAAYVAVIALGYGHLLGPLVVGRTTRRAADRHVDVSTESLHRLRRLLGVTGALVLYLLAVRAWPELVLVLLAFGTWHTVENDRSLAALYANGGRRVPVPRAPGRQLACLGITGFVLAAGAAGIAAGVLAKADYFAATTVYHLISWLVVFRDRAAVLPASERRLLARRLAVAHVPPAALVLLIAGAGGALAPFRVLVVSPEFYLFWSALHVVQTARARGFSSDVQARVGSARPSVGTPRSGRRSGRAPSWSRSRGRR